MATPRRLPAIGSDSERTAIAASGLHNACREGLSEPRVNCPSGTNQDGITTRSSQRTMISTDPRLDLGLEELLDDLCGHVEATIALTEDGCVWRMSCTMSSLDECKQLGLDCRCGVADVNPRPGLARTRL